MERNSQEVKDFVLKEVLFHFHKPEIEVLSRDIQFDNKLTNKQAEMLYRALSESLESKKERLNGLKDVSLIMEIDSLSIYADAFAQYCQGRRFEL